MIFVKNGKGGERKIRGYLVSVRRPAGFVIRHQKMT